MAFQAVEAALFTESGTCRSIEEGEGAFASRQSERTWPAKARQVAKEPVEFRSLILRVFLPFVAGYYIAYLFRTINAVMAAPLTAELGLGADDLGLLTSVYFLTFAAAQIPDRYSARPIWPAADPECAVGGRGDRFWAVRDIRSISGCFWQAGR